MQIRSLASDSNNSMAAKFFFVLMLCIFGVTAQDGEHGHQRHPRQFGGRGGGRGGMGGRPNMMAAGGGGGGGGWRYGGPYRNTWYSTLSKRFDEVNVDNDQIRTGDFLEAAQSLPSFFDLIGQIAFRPARIDNAQNIQKIRGWFDGHQGDADTLQRLVQNEKDNGVGYGGSATEALLWLSRTLDFTAASLRRDFEENKNVSPDDPKPRQSLSEAFKKTYPETLAHHHNEVQRQLFTQSLNFVPRRKEFYRRLAAGDSTQAALEDTEKWVAALETIVRILNDFMNRPESRW